MYFCWKCEFTSENYEAVAYHLQIEHHLNKTLKNLDLKCVGSRNCEKSYNSYNSLKRHSTACDKKLSINNDQNLPSASTNSESENTPILPENPHLSEVFDTNSTENTESSKLIDPELMHQLTNVSHQTADNILRCIQATVQNVLNHIGSTNSSNEKLPLEEKVLLSKLQFDTEFQQIKSSYKRTKVIESSEFFVAPVSKLSVLKLVRKGDLFVQKQKFYQYIPILQTLKALFKNSSFSEAYFNFQLQSDSKFIADFRSSHNFKKNLLFQTHVNGLQIQLYYDDLELCNVCGSKKRIHKIGAIYFTIVNRPNYAHSNLEHIYLVTLFKNEDLKHGLTYNSILEDITKDLKILETEGIEIKNNVRLLGTLVSFTHDNLGGNQMLGFSGGFNAHYFCRFCVMKKLDTQTAIEENKNLLRKIEDYRNTTFDVTKRVDLVATKGINFICKLDDLVYFDIIENGTVDPMHDILEGVGPVLMRLIIQELMNAHNLSIEFVNNRIQNFNYDPADKKSKPSVFNLESFSFSASEFHCLLIYFPFIFGDLISVELEKKWEGVTTLIELTKISFSIKIKTFHVNALKLFISKHLSIMVDEFGINLIPKHHLLTHYSMILAKMGPLYFFSNMRYESFHSKFKRKALRKKNFTNICKSLSTDHQHDLVFQLQNNIEGFKTKIGKISKISKNEELKLKLARKYNLISEFKVVSYYKKGFMYKTNRFIEKKSVFKEINYVIIQNGSVKLLCRNYKTIKYDNFHCSFNVTRTNKLSVVVLDKLNVKTTYGSVISKKDQKMYILSKVLNNID
jgi:hypothetical protein